MIDAVELYMRLLLSCHDNLLFSTVGGICNVVKVGLFLVTRSAKVVRRSTEAL